MPMSKPRIVANDEISGPEKLRRVSELIEDLRDDLADIHLLPHERNADIEQLKIFGRDTANADPIFSPEGIEVFTKLSFHSTSQATSKAALQCLVNALLSKSDSRQRFVNLGYSARATARLKNPKGDDELLISRLLFLTSYDTNQDFGELIDNHGLAEYINDNVSRHIKAKAPKAGQSSPNDSALTETLKLLFNIAYFYPSKRTCLSKSICSILKIITNRPIPSPPLQQPLNHLINGLIYLELDDRRAYAGLAALRLDVRKAVEKLVALLDAALRHYRPADLDSYILPLVSLLKRLAGAGLSDVRPLLREALVVRRNSGASPPTSSSGFLRRGKEKDTLTLPVRLQTLLASPIPTLLHDALSGLISEVAGGPAVGSYSTSRLHLLGGAPRASSPSGTLAAAVGRTQQASVDASEPSARTDSGASGISGASGVSAKTGSEGPSLEGSDARSVFDSRSPSPVAEIVRPDTSSASSMWSNDEGADFQWVDGTPEGKGKARAES